MIAGQRIKILRESLKLSQKQFSEAVSISQSSLSAMESGKTEPAFSTLLEILKRTGANAHWICTGEGPMLVSQGHLPEFSPSLPDAKLRDKVIELQDEVIRLQKALLHTIH